MTLWPDSFENHLRIVFFCRQELCNAYRFWAPRCAEVDFYGIWSDCIRTIYSQPIAKHLQNQISVQEKNKSLNLVYILFLDKIALNSNEYVDSQKH
jgi:hypothetical protein